MSVSVTCLAAICRDLKRAYKAHTPSSTPPGILSVDPVLAALRERKARLREQARSVSRTHTRAESVSAVVDTRAHYHVLSAIDDVVYRRLSGIYQLAPRLFPFAVYPYKLRQMWSENARNSVKLSQACYEAMMRELAELQELAAASPVASTPVCESLAEAWALVCDSSLPPARMQCAIGLPHDKKYKVGWDYPALEYCGALFDSGREIAIARMYRFVREDVQNRILLPAVGAKWCKALNEALQQHIKKEPVRPTPADESLIAMLADDVKPMARYALLGEPSHDYLAFLTSGAQSAPYDSDVKFQMSLEALS